MTAKRTPKPKTEVTHVDVTMADTATMTGTDAVAAIDASLTVADTATMTGESIKPKATWREWIPEGIPEPYDDELISRDTLLNQLREYNVGISPRTLQRWEGLGLIPGPVRKWHDGATRALYAPWVVNVVIVVNAAKVRGDTNDHIIENVHLWVENDLQGRWSGRKGVDRRGIWQTEVMGERIPGALVELADTYEGIFGDRVAFAELRLRGPSGRTLITYRFKIPDRSVAIVCQSGT